MGAAGGPGSSKKDSELKQGESKKAAEAGMGASGPGAEDEEASEHFQGKSDEDANLVDPDADRPDFGGKGPGGAADDDDAEMGIAKGSAKSAKAKEAAKQAAKRAQREKSKPMNPAHLTATVSAIAFLSVAALLWFGRDIGESVLPAAKSFYEKTGVAEARPGDGLRWAESNKRLQRIGGIETLVVKGFVSNIGEIVKPVPAMKLQLLDERKAVIQESETPSPSALLNQNESVEVELRLEFPDMAKAKDGYRMAWSEE